jgi:hypothetical protein
MPLGNDLIARDDLGIDVGQHWPAWLGSLTIDAWGQR